MRSMIVGLMVLLAGIAGVGSCNGTAGTPVPSAIPTGSAGAGGASVALKILAINDFHGNLEPGGSVSVPDPSDPSKTQKVAAGGVEYMATMVKALQKKNPNNILVSSGDLIGASPLLSSLFRDEPTIESMNKLGLAFNAVGNHELDKGRDELLRKQNGGCHPQDGCFFGSFEGAKFKFLSANVFDSQTGKTLFPAYMIREFEGIKVAFIGMTLQGVPAIVSPSGVQGLEFGNEAQTANQLVPELQAQGVESIVVLLHEGGVQAGGFNECKGISGAVVDIVNKMDKAIDVVISAHTHQTYNCSINNKLVTSANQFGRMLTEIDIEIDRTTKDVIGSSANNLIVRNDVVKDAEQTAIMAKYQPKADEVGNRVVGQVSGVLSQAMTEAGESVIGDVIADAQLFATKDPKKGSAVVAFMNSGGIRGEIIPDSSMNVTYRQVFTVQPFGGNLATVTMTGEQIKALLEQQFQGSTNRILQVSVGFSYTWDRNKPAGQRVDIGSIRLNGAALDPKGQYRVTANGFLMTGGDDFTVLKSGTNQVGGDLDVDALAAYIGKNSPLVPPKTGRITRNP